MHTDQLLNADSARNKHIYVTITEVFIAMRIIQHGETGCGWRNNEVTISSYQLQLQNFELV